jgi:hypothetical protein
MNTRAELQEYREKTRRSVVQIALNVHIHNNQTYVRDVNVQSDDIRHLQRSLEHWQGSVRPAYEQFDNAVYQLIVTALRESEAVNGR